MRNKLDNIDKQKLPKVALVYYNKWCECTQVIYLIHLNYPIKDLY